MLRAIDIAFSLIQSLSQAPSNILSVSYTHLFFLFSTKTAGFIQCASSEICLNVNRQYIRKSNVCKDICAMVGWKAFAFLCALVSENQMLSPFSTNSAQAYRIYCIEKARVTRGEVHRKRNNRERALLRRWQTAICLSKSTSEQKQRRS